MRLPLALITVMAISLQSALAEFKVGLVLDRGGKDDKSFNASAYQGATDARKILKLEMPALTISLSSPSQSLSNRVTA